MANAKKQIALRSILKQMKDEVAGKPPKPKKVKSSDLSKEPDDSILKWMVTTVTTPELGLPRLRFRSYRRKNT